jgi:hypothetical protein
VETVEYDGLAGDDAGDPVSAIEKLTKERRIRGAVDPVEVRDIGCSHEPPGGCGRYPKELNIRCPTGSAA